MKNFTALVLACFLIFLFGCNSELKDWESAQTVNTIESYEKFISEHSNSNKIIEAKEKIDQLNNEIINIMLPVEIKGYEFDFSGANIMYEEDGAPGQTRAVFDKPIHPNGILKSIAIGKNKTLVPLLSDSIKNGVIQTQEYGEIIIIMKGPALDLIDYQAKRWQVEKLKDL